MSDPTPLRLNLGASQTRIPGFVNIDICSQADLTLDLGKDRLPFEDGSVDVVFTYHTLEHIPDYLFCLSEIYRVLAHGAHLLVGVPYVTLTEYNLVNPYHLHNFSEFSFDFFELGKLKGSASEENSIQFQKVFHRFEYIGRFARLPAPLRDWSRRHLFNVVRSIDFGLMAVKEPRPVPACDPAAMQAEFAQCLSARVPY
jgi:SAM-dependent methyltransferase